MSRTPSIPPAPVGRNGLRRDLFGINRTPFASTAPLYVDDAREELLVQAASLINRRGFACVHGSPGCGKTSFLRHVCAQPDERSVQIAYVPFSMFKEGDLLRTACRQFNLEPPFRKSALIRALQDYAVSLGEAVNPILVIDEVQLMDQATLELLRILGNHRFETGNLFTIFLCGGEEFMHRLQLRINEPLRQRISAAWHLEAFDRHHTAGYLRHHLRHAGTECEVFPPEIVNRIFDETRGVPRLINTLALAAMEHTAAAAATTVTAAHIDKAVRNLPQRKENRHHDPETL
jgi:general secretion pathway protein A